MFDVTNLVAPSNYYESFKYREADDVKESPQRLHLPAFIPNNKHDDTKGFKAFALNNSAETKKLKGGEIGFIISQSKTTRQGISLVQNLISKAPHNRDAVHAFVVLLNEGDDKTMRIGEATETGLKEARKKLSDLEDDEL